MEGILALYDPVVRSLYDLKVSTVFLSDLRCENIFQVFVQCDSDLMLARRLRRDVQERGRDVDGILDQ